MEPSQRSKPPPGGQPASRPASGRASEGTQAPSGSDGRASEPTGRVRHDERGNAVWDWLKDTGRNAFEATSRLLRKLEAPDLKIEDTKDEEPRLESDRDPGGGYDPYNQSAKPRGRPPGK